MSLEADLILRGKPMGPVPDCSLGEYLVEKMKLLPQDQIIQVDGDTGATQTVGELFEMGARVSEGLRNLGLKQGDVVAMISRNCFEATEIVLGSWLSAAAVMPLATTMKTGELKYVFELTQPKFIFCEEEAVNNATAALELLLMSTTFILIMDTKKPQDPRLMFREILADVDIGNYLPQSVESPSTETVTILFSSGTTGLPKAVTITHKNFVFQDQNMNVLNIFSQTLDFLQISQFFWVTAHLFFLRSLTTGMKRVMVRNPTVINILKVIEKYKPQWSMMAPLFTLSIANHPDFEKFDVSSLKYIVVGGSPFTPSMGEKLKKKWEGLKITQSYGTTEATGNLCNTYDEEPLSLGKVGAGVQLKVVDVATGKPLGPNALGEIWVKSPGIMRGYLKNEKATKEALVEGGWLRTGDVGYYDESRRVHLVDRQKEVVKIKNMQVAPTEVENTILSIPGVLEAFVTGVTPDGDFVELLALVVKERDSPVTEETICAHVASTLSEYKQLTGGVYFVESLPKTDNGKLSRSELRKRAQELYSTKSR